MACAAYVRMRLCVDWERELMGSAGLAGLVGEDRRGGTRSKLPMRGEVKGVWGRKGVAGAWGVSPAPELVSLELTRGMLLGPLAMVVGSGKTHRRRVVTKR